MNVATVKATRFPNGKTLRFLTIETAGQKFHGLIDQMFFGSQKVIDSEIDIVTQLENARPPVGKDAPP